MMTASVTLTSSTSGAPDLIFPTLGIDLAIHFKCEKYLISEKLSPLSKFYITFSFLWFFLKTILLQVVNTFYTSLQCDLQCKDLVDKDLKAECEVQFCKKADEDEYDYGDI